MIWQLPRQSAFGDLQNVFANGQAASRRAGPRPGPCKRERRKVSLIAKTRSGPVGAIGSQSHGIVNIQNQHSAIEQVDMNVLAMQLEQLRAAYRQTSTSREDDRQVALIGDAADAAERGDRHKVASFLSKMSKSYSRRPKTLAPILPLN